MRNRYKTIKQELGQFLTPEPIAKLLASLLPTGGTSLLELGAGDGALLAAICERFEGLNITAVERDHTLRARLRTKGLVDKLIAGDASSQSIQRRLAIAAPFDYAVGNPPYALAANSISVAQSMVELGLNDSKRGVRLDTLFLAQSISMLKESGAGAFVLPLPLFSDSSFMAFRTALLQRFSSVTVIELPTNTFGQAEVSTAICSFHNLDGKRKKIRVGTANSSGQIETCMSISEKSAIHRMDHGYHHELVKLQALVGKNPCTLKKIGAQVVRGSATSAELKNEGIDYLHTSDLPSSGIGHLSFWRTADKRFQHASIGDIVVPRVGTRCLFRQAVVHKGAIPFTESIFRIRVDDEFRDAVLDSLAGPIGQSWRRLHARGTCAKHITSVDLYELPL